MEGERYIQVHAPAVEHLFSLSLSLYPFQPPSVQEVRRIAQSSGRCSVSFPLLYPSMCVFVL
jgi:hypothetical protein